MQDTTHTHLNAAGRRVAISVATLMLVGCTHGIGPDVPRSVAATLAASKPVVIGSTTRATTESQTLSLALDRIDQRELPLDRTYRRQGTGRGVVVYVFDGGILADHPELAGRVRKGYDAFAHDPAVCNAHGTAVAGAIAGRTLGVAPEATVVDIKMVECSKLRGTIKAIVDGAKWAIEDHRKHGRPSVANWSFIADTSSRIPQLDSAVSMLRAAGISVVVSAGNIEMNACRISPGNAEGTIVVGASALARDVSGGRQRPIDRRSHNTAFGPCVDVYAPGDSVLLPSFDGGKVPTVQLWNGTSMSAGYVSGAAALFLEGNPAASPDQVGRHIRENATTNVVTDSGSPFSRMLYVGPTRDEFRSVAEIRAAMGRR